MTGKILMKKGAQVVTANPQDTIAQATGLLKKEKIGALIIVDDNETMVGVLSERDIVQAIPEHGAALFDMPVEELMTTDVKVCSTEDRMRDIMKMMSSGRFRHMPVVEDGMMVAIISIGDVVKTRLEQLENEANQMREFIGGRGY